MGQILPALWIGAFEYITISREKKDDRDQIVVWKKLLGKRNAAGKRWIMDHMTPWIVSILALVLEPFRFLTTWFFRASSRRRRNNNWSAPPLSIFVTESTSPVVQVLQHFSGLLQGTATRCILLYGRQGYGSLDELAEALPEVVAIFRRAVSCAASWVARRLWSCAANWPKRLAVVVNSFASPAEKAFVLADFWQTPLEDLDEFMGRRLKARLRSAQELMEERYQNFLHTWAFRCLLLSMLAAIVT